MLQQRQMRIVKVGVVVAGCILIFGLGSTLSAKEAANAQNVVSIDVLGFAMGVNVIEYERVMKPNLSLLGQVRFLSQDDEDWKASGFGLFFGTKRYFKETAPEKFWWGSSIGFISVSATDKSTGDKGSGTLFSGVLNIGYKWLLGGKKITVEPSAGLASFLGKIEAGGETYLGGGLGITLGLTIGYAF